MPLKPDLGASADNQTAATAIPSDRISAIKDPNNLARDCVVDVLVEWSAELFIGPSIGRRAAHGGLHGNGHLRCRSAKADKGQANDERRDTEALGGPYGTPDQKFTTDDEEDEATDKTYNCGHVASEMISPKNTDS